MHHIRLLHARLLELLALTGTILALERSELDGLAPVGRLQNRTDDANIGEPLDARWFRIAIP